METDNIIDLGITPQSVYYNDLVERAISFNKFKIPGDNNIPGDNKNYMFLEKIDKNKIDKLSPLLKNDEIFGYSDNAVFTYIIGSQCPIIDNQITRVQYTNNFVNINDMQIWGKPVLSKQEINTRHLNILFDSKKNYDIIMNNTDPNIDISVAIKTGVIDNIFYAGEMRYSVLNGNKTIELNFLSGTFMIDVIDCLHVPDLIIQNITKFFRESPKLGFNGELKIVNNSCETFITKNIDKRTLDDYILSGMTVHENPNFLESEINILENQLKQKERMKTMFTNDSSLDVDINAIKKQIEEKTAELNNITSNTYKPDQPDIVYGGKSKKNKGKSIKKGKKKTRKTRKTIKTRKTRKTFNKK